MKADHRKGLSKEPFRGITLCVEHNDAIEYSTPAVYVYLRSERME